MAFNQNLKKSTLLIAPPLMLVLLLVLSAGILNAARQSTDRANARMLYVVGVMSTTGNETTPGIEPYLPSMPVPQAYGDLRRFTVVRMGDRILVYAMQDENSGYLFDPATNEFDRSPVDLSDSGTVLLDS